MSKAVIEAFLQRMRERHTEEIEAIELPEGTEAYLGDRIKADDTETLLFMLKLAYLMGLHTGYAAHQAEEAPQTTPRGPMQA